MNISYKVLKPVIRRFRIYHYFCEISKFRDFINILNELFKRSFCSYFREIKKICETIYINRISRSCLLKYEHIICSFEASNQEISNM